MGIWEFPSEVIANRAEERLLWVSPFRVPRDQSMLHLKSYLNFWVHVTHLQDPRHMSSPVAVRLRGCSSHVRVSVAMLLALLTWVQCLVIAAAVRQFCSHDKSTDAFLTDVTNGLPSQLRSEFCNRSGGNAAASPRDTGIEHYVLTGSIVADKLGKRQGQYNTLQLGEVAPFDMVQIPVSLHLWMRALCNEYAPVRWVLQLAFAVVTIATAVPKHLSSMWPVQSKCHRSGIWNASGGASFAECQWSGRDGAAAHFLGS